MDTHNPEYLFRQTAASIRRNGARGGRATARNRRLRGRSARLVPAPQPEMPSGSVETTAHAIARLDDQFSWLRGCEKKHR